MADDSLTSPLAVRLATGLHARADRLDDRRDMSPGWYNDRHPRAVRLREFASHLSSDEAARVLQDIEDLEPIFGPLDVAWAVEIAGTSESTLSFLLTPVSAQAWVKLLRARYEAGATMDGLGDDQ